MVRNYKHRRPAPRVVAPASRIAVKANAWTKLKNLATQLEQDPNWVVTRHPNGSISFRSKQIGAPCQVK